MDVIFRPEEELEAVHEGLMAYNRKFFKETGDLSCCIEDEDGKCIAGALVWRADELVMVDILWVDEDHRGQGLGKQVLDAVEAQGKRLGARFLELNTFGFQAPGFYAKLGYRPVGAVEGCIGRYGHYYFVKEL